MSGSRTSLAVGAWLAVIAAAAPAHAQYQPVADPKIQKADELFAEGKALLDSNLLQACGKFDESLKLNGAALGTLLNVALCDEKLGRFASAVARFEATRDLAKEQGLPRYVETAEQHLADLVPNVPHLSVQLAEQLPGTQILIDDHVVAPNAIASIAVDPGERVIVVSAPGRLPYRGKLVIAKAEHKTVTVPALAKSIVVTSSLLRIGELAALVGVVGAGTGLGIGIYARHLYNEQFDNGACMRTNKECTSAGLTNTHRAHTLGNTGTIVGAAGIAVAIAGGVLWYVAPRSHTSAPAEHASITVVPDVGPSGLGVAAIGRF